MTPGEKLSALRSQKKLSQEDLCRAINKRFPWIDMQRNTYARWELDDNEFGWEIAKAFALFYRITIDELIFADRKIQHKTKKRKQYATA